MPVSFGNLGLAEPSTITARVATVVVQRGSTNEQQEILVVGDPQTSNALARVVAAAPVSTEFGMVVRIASGPSSAADLPVFISGNSTVIQGTSPWVVGFQAGNVSSAAQSGNSSGLTVRPVWSSSGIDQPVRANLSSTAADNPVAISGNSTVIQGTSPWVIGFPAGYISSGAQSGNSSGLTVRPVWSSSGIDQPVRANLSSTAADNPVLVSGNSTVFQGGSPWTVTFSAGNISSAAQSGNSSGLTVRPVWSSSGVDQPVRANLSSTAADNPVLISGNSTVVQGTSPWVVADVMQSSLAPSSGTSGVIVRQVIDNILTTASTNAFSPSTSFTIQSSGASIRSYVTAYSILSTNAGPHKIKFYSSGTMTWPVMFAAVSSAVSGANLAVSAPAYLFRTAASEALTLQLGSGASTIGGYQVAVSYFRAP